MDCEPARVFDEKVIKARKDYRCCECGGIIPKSEQYNRAQGLWENGWDTFKSCGDCEAMRCDFTSHSSWDECIAFGELEQLIIESRDPAWLARFKAVQKSRATKGR